MALTNIYMACKLNPIFLLLPNVKVLVFCVHGYLEMFWELTRVVPYSSYDSIPTRDEQQMLELGRVILMYMDELNNITASGRFQVEY